MGLLGKGGLGGLLGGIQRQTQGGLLDPDRLARVMAFAYGDYGEAAQIGDSMAQRELQQRQQQQAQAELQRRAQILMQRGVPEEEAYALAGDDTAFRQIVAPDQDEFERNAKRAGIAPGSPEYVEAAKQRMIGDPFVTTTLPGGQFYAGRASQLPGAFGQGAAPGLTPMTDEEIDALGLPRGGPGAGRPGGFRR